MASTKRSEVKGLRTSLIRLASEQPVGSPERKALATLLTAAWSLAKGDKKVIDAFLDKKALESKKMSTDGKTLDIIGMGGRGVAKWVGDKIDLVDLGSRTGQTVHRFIRKQAPAAWLKKGSKKQASSDSLLWQVIDRRAFSKMRSTLAKEDPASAALLKDVVVRLMAELKLDTETEQAVNRLANGISSADRWPVEQHRNNLGKIANLLGLRTPLDF